MLQYITLHYIALHFIALHCIALHCIALHCIALHCIALHCIALHCIALYCIALHCIIIAIHCITLHYITLHYITLHYITLHYITLHHITLHVLPALSCNMPGIILLCVALFRRLFLQVYVAIYSIIMYFFQLASYLSVVHQRDGIYGSLIHCSHYSCNPFFYLYDIVIQCSELRSLIKYV